MINITGTSFGLDFKDYTILADGIPCHIKSMSRTKISCQVEPGFASPEDTPYYLGS